MFWDVIERIQDYFRMTVRPALRSLFSSKSFFISMLLAVFVLQTLLCVICFAGVNNTKNQNALLEACTSYIAGLNVDAREALAEQVKVLMNSAGIFTGALIIWWLCAVTVYYRLATASAERNRYLWGMYMTFGSERRKLRKMLGVDMFLTLFCSTLLGLPTAFFLCRAFSGTFPGYLPTVTLLAVAISFVTVKICIVLEVRSISSKSCSALLSAEDTAGNVTPPRGSGRLTGGFTPARYALTAFLRLRKYYALVALAAAVPCVIWVCCMTASTSETAQLNSDINEFSLTLSSGFDKDQLDDEYVPYLESLTGVRSAQYKDNYLASMLGTHIKLERSSLTSTASAAIFSPTYAIGDIYIVDASDPSFRLSTGYNAQPERGCVSIIYPESYTVFDFSDLFDTTDSTDGDTSGDDSSSSLVINEEYIKLAVSKQNGRITVVSDVNASLRSMAAEEYEFVELRIQSAFPSREETISRYTDISYTKIVHPYFVLNHDDYTAITSLTQRTERISTDDFTLVPAAYSNGSFDIVVNRRLAELPTEGCSISVSGSATLSASVDGKYLSYDSELQTVEETVKNVTQPVEISELYVLSAKYDGGRTVITVAPRVTIGLHMFRYGPVIFGNCLVIGAPDIQSNDCDVTHDIAYYNARNYSRRFSVSYSGLNLGSMTLNYATAHRAVDVGTFVSCDSNLLTNPSNHAAVAQTFAINDFSLAYLDETTAEKYGIDIPELRDGETVILYPEFPNFRYDTGDKIRLAIAQPFSSDEPIIDNVTRLQKQIEVLEYRYSELTVRSVATVTGLSEAVIIVTRDDFTTVTGQSSPYTQIDVLISPRITLEQYANLNNSLKKWIASDPERTEIQLTSSNSFIDITLRRSADYSVWLRLISLLVPFLIFPLWYYPQTMMMARRRQDYVMLDKIGKSRRDIRRIFLFESLLAAGAAVLGIIILCPLGVAIFGFVTKYFELPLSFSLRHFAWGSLGLSALIGCVSGAATIWMGHFAYTSRRTKNVNT